MTKAGDAISDSAVTGKVKTALLADPDVKGLKIDVETKDGVVTLNGTADNSANSSKATTVARGIEGVKSVENKLTVKP
jgi:hyperosmotically inducible protein